MKFKFIMEVLFSLTLTSLNTLENMNICEL